MAFPLMVPLKLAEEEVMVQSCIGEVPSTAIFVDLPVMFCAFTKPKKVTANSSHGRKKIPAIFYVKF